MNAQGGDIRCNTGESEHITKGRMVESIVLKNVALLI